MSLAVLKMQTTIKLRLRDKHAAELNRQARAVNFVWNYLNDAQRHMLRWDRWLSTYAFQRLTAGACKELDLHAHTIKCICDAYVRARRTHNRTWLRWRGRKSLGWVPFSTGHVTFDGSAFVFRGQRYQAIHLRDTLRAGVKIGAGSFNQDASGRWYLNLPIEIDCADSAPNSRAGIDLGLATLATISTGAKIEAPRFYRASEAALAVKQRARKSPARIRKLHAKIANRRKDFLHKATARLSSQFGLIVVGNVRPSQLAKTRMAKSVLDAGWSDFRRMLSYKSIRNGGSTLEVSEAYTSQACSECGCLGGPKGLKGLQIREWECAGCGSVHDRDVNSARLILARGLASLAEGAA